MILYQLINQRGSGNYEFSYSYSYRTPESLTEQNSTYANGIYKLEL